jgi:hypothetical protein
MRNLKVFNSVSVDGFFTDDQGDMSWAHKQDAARIYTYQHDTCTFGRGDSRWSMRLHPSSAPRG